jgi:hypothetical protein
MRITFLITVGNKNVAASCDPVSAIGKSPKSVGGQVNRKAFTMTKLTQPTFDLETLRAIIATPEAKALFAEMQGKPASQDIDKLTIQAFKRKGFTDIHPRVNVLTYSRWVEKGFKVKPGTKAVRIKSLRLFHETQVEPISKAEQVKYLKEREARMEVRTADKLSPVTPITAAKPNAKAKKPALVSVRDQPSA